MPRPRPFVALHGQVDFNSLRQVVTPGNTDIFVCRQGAQGDNVFVTRAQIRDAVPGEQLIMDAGLVGTPGLAVLGDLNTGAFSPAADQFAITAGGVLVANFVEAAGATQLIIDPGLTSTEALPGLAFGDGDTGFLETSDDNLGIVVGGTRFWQITSGLIGSSSASQPRMLRETPSATNPNFIPRGDDGDTGLGWRVANVGVLVGGAQNCMEFGGVGAVPEIAFYGAAAIALQTGVAVTAAGIHAALVNLNLITA